MNESKEYDIFLNMLDNSDKSLSDLMLAGMNIDNSYLLDKEKYKSNEQIKEAFTNSSGSFDEPAFDKFYDSALMFYNKMSDDKYEDEVKKQMTYHRDNIYTPVEQREKAPQYKWAITPNPFEITYGIGELGKAGERTKSVEEIAQTKKVLLNPTEAGEDFKNAKWGDTPNDSFFPYFFNTLVLAQYDEDGEHKDPLTGEVVQHKKGDLKLNPDGDVYYEALDGRDPTGKIVLNKINTLTTDGSWANRFDPFDSDDIKEKSIGGSLVKNLALVGSMFIPGVGPWIAGISILTQSAGLAAILGKMLIDSDSPLFNEIQGWSQSVSRRGALTEEAKENPWSWESLINMAGDIAGQLTEQRFIFNTIPAVFKGTNIGSKTKLANYEKKVTEKYDQLFDYKIQTLKNNTPEELFKNIEVLNAKKRFDAANEIQNYVKNYNKIGKAASIGYMTALTVSDTYGEAKQAGASDIEATLLTLGYAAAEAALLNTGLGEWILPELRAGRYRYEAIRKALLEGQEGSKSSIRGLMSQTTNIPKEKKRSWALRLFNAGKNIAKGEYVNGAKTVKSTVAAGIGEGLEETSEELLADFSKGAFNTVAWLRGDDTKLSAFGYDPTSDSFDNNNLFDRYSLSLIGGFFGGAAANVGANYRVMNDLGNMNYQTAVQELVNIVRNGEANNFLKQINKQTIGDPNLSTDYEKSENGTYLFKPGTKDNNQDLQAKSLINQTVSNIQRILSSEGAVSDSELLDRNTLNELKFAYLQNSTVAGALIQEYNQLSSDIVQFVNQINSARTSGIAEKTDEQKRREKSEGSDTEKSQVDNFIERKTKELQDKKQQLDDLINGKRTLEFISRALFEMSSGLSYDVGSIFPLYAQVVYKKRYQDLTEQEKAQAYKSYESWKTSGGRDTIITAADLFYEFNKQVSPKLQEVYTKYKDVTGSYKEVQERLKSLYNTINSPIDIQDTQKLLLSQLGDIEYLLSDGNLQIRLQELENKYKIKEEDTEQEKQDKKQKLQEEQSELLLNNLQSVIDSQVEKVKLNQWVNQDLKDVLKSLIQIQNLHINSQMEEVGFNEQEQLNSDIVKNISYIKTLDSLSTSPVFSIIKGLAVNTNGVDLDIEALNNQLQQILNDYRNNIENITLEDSMVSNLKRAIGIMELYRKILLAARTDYTAVNNVFGFNTTLNEIAERTGEENYSPLFELDSFTADNMLLDLDVFLNKFKFFESLYFYNTGQKLSRNRRVAAKVDLLVYKKLKYLIQVPELKKWEGYLELSNTISGATLHDKLLLENNTQTDIQQAKDLEKESIQIQDAIYEFFQKNKDKLYNINTLKELLNPAVFNFYDKSNELLNENLANLDDNSFIWWLASRASVKSSEFFKLYKDYLNPNSDTLLAPLPIQELGVFLNYTLITDPSIFQQFTKAIKKSIKEDWKQKSKEDREKVLQSLDADVNLATNSLDDYCLNFLPTPRYNNTSLVEGVAGSGKSSAVIKITLDLLKISKPEIVKNIAVVHGVSKARADQLKKDIQVEAGETYGRLELLKLINPAYQEPVFNEKTQKYDYQNYLINQDGEIVSSDKTTDTTNPPSLIVIDEISQFTSFEIDQINDYAKKHNIVVITAGDFDQSGVVGQIPVTIDGVKYTFDFALDRFLFARTPKLGISMRTDNNIKTSNNSKVQAYMQNPTEKTIPTLQYYIDETGIYGDVVINYAVNIARSNNQITSIDNSEQSLIVEQVLRVVDNMIQTLKPGEKIGYIYHSTDSPIYKALQQEKYKQHIDFRKGSSALGAENQYYIQEVGISDNRKQLTKDFYTGVTRAKQGSVIIAPYSKDKATLDISSSEIKTKIPEQVSKAAIIKSIEEKIDILNSALGEVKTPQTQESETVSQQSNTENEVTQIEDQIENQTEETDTQAPIIATPPANTEEETEPISPSPYQDQVILGDELNSDQDKKESIDNDTKKLSTPEPSSIGEDSFELQMFSFNTFETGVLVDPDGYPIPNGGKEWGDVRIDSINGLMKIDQLNNHPIRKVREYEILIGKIRQLIFNIENKAELLKRVKELLNLPDLYGTFAYKSSARNKGDREFVDSSPQKFSKGNSEEVLYTGSSDTLSNKAPNKSLVVIFGTEENGDLLELPLLTVTSPFTLVQFKQDGEYIFKEVLDYINSLKGEDLHTISIKVQERFENQSKYSNLLKLFRLFDLTDNAIFFIRDNNWTIAKNLQTLGPQFTQIRGSLDLLPGRQYSSGDINTEWVDLYQFTKDPNTSDPSSYTTNIYQTDQVFIDAGNNVTDAIQMGHPFVLRTYDPDLNSDKKVIDYYLKQLGDNSLPKKVVLIYVLPPKASIREYLENLKAIVSKNNPKPIGTLFTSYQLLNILLQNQEFKDYLNKRLPGYAEKIQAEIDQINSLETNIDKKNKLFSTALWLEISKQRQHLAGLFDGVLLNIAYNNNTIKTYIDTADTSINQEGVQLIERILSENGIDSVRYNAKISKNSVRIGNFVQVDNTNYRVDGKSYQIHGKIDPPMFKMEFGEFLDYIFSRLRYNRGHWQSLDGIQYNSGKSKLGNIRKPQIEPQIKNLSNEVAEINLAYNNKVAFIIDNQVIESPENSIFEGQVVITDLNNNPITTLPPSNTGIYSFYLKSTAGNYLAKYDSKNKILELIDQNQSSNQTVPFITEQEFMDNDLKQTILSQIDPFDVDLQQAFTAQSFTDFLQILQEDVDLIQGRVDNYRNKQLELDKNSLEYRALDILINIDKYLDPDTQQDACPISHIIKFTS